MDVKVVFAAVAVAVIGVLLAWGVNQLPAMKPHISTSRRWIFVVVLVMASVAAGVLATRSGGDSGRNDAAAAGPTRSTPVSPTTVSPAATPSLPDPAASEPELSESADAAGIDAVTPTYSTVPLIMICTDCSGSQEIGGRIFAYNDTATATPFPNYWKNRVLDGVGSSCRSLTVRFGGDDSAQATGSSTMYLKFVQQSGNVQASTKPGTVGKVEVPLDGGPLQIDASVSNHPGTNEVLLNISGSCSTANGIK